MTDSFLPMYARKPVNKMNKDTFTRSHRIKQAVILLGALLISLLVLAPAAQADVGPKPSMTFEFIYETEAPLTIVEGEQLQCDEETCADAMPLEEAGPQEFKCSATACSSMAYGYSDYNRLVIRFSDGVTRESNVFCTGSFETEYRVTVRENDLVVEKTGGRPSPLTLITLGGLAGIAVVGVLGVALLFVVVRLIVKGRRD